MSTSRAPRTVVLLLAGLLALLAIVAATFWLSQRAQVYSRDVIALRDVRVSAVTLRTSLLTAESSQRGYLFAKNEIYLAPYDGAKLQATRALAELDGHAARYPRFADLVARLGGVTNDKLAEMDASIALARSGDDGAALEAFLTNRGKSLMDQANLFASGIVEATDAMLAERVSEQAASVDRLRWMSLAGAFVVILVVAGAVDAFRRTTREIAGARDEVRAINASLESRVEERTQALKKALDRSELLLSEVNHRVANSLALVASLVRLQGNASRDDAVKAALTETHTRIAAISSVHKRLYESGDVGLVALDEYLSGLLDGLAVTMKAEGRGGSLSYELAPIRLPTDASVNLGIVVTELVTNAYKYAYPDEAGDIRVSMRRLSDDRFEVVVEDDGVGRGSDAPKGTGLGSRIVKAMAGNLGTKIEYAERRPGTSARLAMQIPGAVSQASP